MIHCCIKLFIFVIAIWYVVARPEFDLEAAEAEIRTEYAEKLDDNAEKMDQTKLKVAFRPLIVQNKSKLIPPTPVVASIGPTIVCMQTDKHIVLKSVRIVDG